MKRHKTLRLLLSIAARSKLLSVVLLLVVVGGVVAALLPPLVLENLVNRLAGRQPVPFGLALCYFGLIVLSGLLDAAREGLLTVYGQAVTRGLRHQLCAKLSRLPADFFARQEPGATAARFVGDVDTVESLFTSGIISMFADGCKVVSIFAILLVKNRGLFLLLLLLFPFLFWFTRTVQKRILAAQLENRAAVGKVSSQVPETIRCIRTIRLLGKERYMQDKYDRSLLESYRAVSKTNFYDSVYSPVILVLNALVVAAVMLLSASGTPALRAFFGMSVGTAVAVISYLSQVFGPIQSIGMEIQTIQSAVAGLRRIDDFLSLPERWDTDPRLTREAVVKPGVPSIELREVSFSYDPGVPVLERVSFTVESGQQVVLTGRTGAGKSTLFKLLLGLYRPDKGRVLIYGQDAHMLPDAAKRALFGYVEQSFRRVPGTVLDQITLFSPAVTEAQARKAAATVGLHQAILELPQGYQTPCAPGLFSQGQWQLLSIARAIAAEPPILLLDEITANLDAATEQLVLEALKKASANRTVLSISHRLYQQTGAQHIAIGGWENG